MSHEAVAVPATYQADVLGAAKAYGIAPNDLAALLDYESAWNPRAQSSAGALGIAQFMPGTANGLSVNPYNPRSAIFGAAKYLHQLGYASNRLLAFAKYNAGPGNPAAGAGYAQEVNHRSAVVSFGGKTVRPSTAPSSSSTWTSSPSSSSSSSGWQDWLKRTALTLTMAGTGIALTGVGIRNALAARKVPA
jgi:soluble lytic murein transglycosylase-like protein